MNSLSARAFSEETVQNSLKASGKDVFEEASIIPVYQPILARSVGRYGFEALARKIDEAGNLLPIDFPGLTLEAYKSLDKVMLRSITLDLPKLKARGARFLSINCSPSLMDRYTAMEILRLPRLAQKHGIELWVEVVESDPLSFDGSRLLVELESVGAKIALDDYGIAHSNYLRLMEVPASLVKLDVCMLRSARGSTRAFSLLRDLIGYLQRRGIQIVAEGVEDDVDIAIAYRLAVDYQQGYAHGRPARL